MDYSTVSVDDLLQKLEGYREISANNIPNDLGIEIVKRAYPEHKYEFVIDMGGESCVMLTTDKTDRKCAIKVPHYRLTHNVSVTRDIYKTVILGWQKVLKTQNVNKYVERFKEGVKIQNKLSSENTNSQFVIPKVYEMKTDPFLNYSMEFIEGIKIMRWVSEKHQLSTSLKLFIKCLEAFNYCHEFGIVHRDIKSDNIYYTTKDRVAILDWTLSKMIGRNLTVTGSELPMGSVPYASPKMLLQKNASEAVYPDDIFSLGILMFEFITFQKIQPTRSYDLFNEKDFARYLRDLEISVPEILLPIFKRATQMDEDKRYALIPSFLDDVKSVYEDIDSKFKNYEPFSTSSTAVLLPNASTLQFDCTKCLYECKYDFCNKLKTLIKLLE